MAISKAPNANLRNAYRIHQQIGLIASLAVLIGAFTIPLPTGEDVVMMEDTTEIIEIETIEQTQQTLPPPPPPAALPPPQEVPDDVELVEDVIEEIDLDLTANLLPPAAPPAPPAPPPPPPPRTPDAPPPPPPPDPEPTEQEIFEVVETPPELIGGLEALQASVVYPEMAIMAGIEGRVHVQFVVDEQGRVIDPFILRSPSDVLSAAAIDAVLKCKFTPGLQRGRPVRVRYTVPVKFELVNGAS
ncbi:MAG: energy transducer TonB [Bacteroidota bacterium]